PVEGKILFSNGKVLPAGTRLLFTPGEGDRAGAKAVVSEDGSFKVTHLSGAEGAEVGKYTILLAAPEGDHGSLFKSVPREHYDGGVLNTEVKEGLPPLDLRVMVKRR